MRLNSPAADPAPNGAAEQLPLLLSARQAAALCGASEATWWRLHAAARCPAPVRLGSLTRWRAEELRAWITAGCPDRAEWEARQRAAGNDGGRR